MKKHRLLTLFIAACFALSVFSSIGLASTETAHAETKTLDIYAINDFHGAVDKMPQIAGYLAARKSEGAVIVNSGDMFQGSMESNSNYGRLLTECMDLAGFDAFTFGNHEFDWGLDNLRNLARSSNVPFLGANIYNWNANTRTWGEFASDLAQPYTVVEADNLKVGIIGIIGKDQITSISSQLVQTVGFKDPKDIVPNLSNKLRNEENCDAVIVSAHTGQDTFFSDDSWDITQYADAVMCAHTHQAEMQIKNGVPFIQGAANGNYVSHVRLSLDGNGNVQCDTYENISYSRLSTNVDNAVKSDVQAKIDNSNAAIESERTQVLATLSGGYLNSSTAVPRLVCHAIAEYATSRGYAIDLAMVNNARSSLSQGNITYTSLYNAIPFDNVVYIAKVSGRDILNEANYSSTGIWRVTGNIISNSNYSYYTIAVIDYLLFHQNVNRNYNYFRSAFESGFTPVALEKEGVEMYNYRLITRDFLLKTGSINASTYTGNNIHTDKSQLTSRVDLPTFSEGTAPGATSPAQTPSNSGLPVYAIVLIVVGAVLVVAAAVAVTVVLTHRKRAK